MSFSGPKKIFDIKDAQSSLESYCAYRDRSNYECEQRLKELGIIEEARNEIISKLISDGFLNEERFALSYVRGKFNIKKWGRVKIKDELRVHQIGAYLTKKAFDQIDESEYLSVLESELIKKWDLMPGKNSYDKKAKLAKWAYSRGYESGLVWDLIKSLYP